MYNLLKADERRWRYRITDGKEKNSNPTHVKVKVNLDEKGR